MAIKKVQCPNCHAYLPEIRYNEQSAHCNGITFKCRKCGKIVEIVIKSVDKEKNV